MAFLLRFVGVFLFEVVVCFFFVSFFLVVFECSGFLVVVWWFLWLTFGGRLVVL